MVGVCITAYNHEKYIESCIKSVLSQKCDEPIAVYIGEDCSHDNTKPLCTRLANQYPNIRLFCRPTNIGLAANTIDLLQRMYDDGCEYIAMLDGDDYWIDEYKLQKQIDFLRKNPQYGLIHTGYYEQQGEHLYTPVSVRPIPIGDVTPYYQYIGADIMNCTVLFRANLLQYCMLQDYRPFSVVDFVMYGVFAVYTQFAYLPEKTSVWRVHTSVSHPKSSEAIIKYHQDKKQTWRYLHDTFPSVYPYSEQEADGRINTIRLNLAYFTNDMPLAKEALRHPIFPRTLKMRTKMFCAQFPILFHLLARLISHKYSTLRTR